MGFATSVHLFQCKNIQLTDWWKEAEIKETELTEFAILGELFYVPNPFSRLTYLSSISDEILFQWDQVQSSIIYMQHQVGDPASVL